MRGLVSFALLPLLAASYRVIIIGRQDSEAKTKAVENLRRSLAPEDKLFYWERNQNGLTEVFADFNTTERLLQRLSSADLHHKVMEDVPVDAWMAAERAANSDDFMVDGDPTTFSLDKYHSHEEILSFVKALALRYPSIATPFSIGYTFEGRQMRGIKFGRVGAPKANRPSLYIEAGVHAREWIAPATALYIMNQLASKYSVRSDVKALLDAVDVYIMPLGNPDGYEYSRIYLQDNDIDKRFWRKTRSTYNVNIFSRQICIGGDPNRNYDWHWNTTGVSTNPCDSDYPGNKPFSEMETTNTRNFLQKLKASANLQFYLSLHSYGQEWLVPYGSDLQLFPPNYQAMFNLANLGVRAIQKVNSAFYVPLNSAELYESSGAADDWARGILDVPFTYTLEIRPTASPGFLLPPSQIIPTGQEVFEGILAVASTFRPSA